MDSIIKDKSIKEKKAMKLLFWESPETKKQCKDCLEFYPVQKFYLDKSTKEGRNVRCVTCENAYAAKRRAKVKKIEKERVKNNRRIGEYNKALIKLRKEDREKFIAEYTYNKIVIDRKDLVDLQNILRSRLNVYPIINHKVFEQLKKTLK